MAAGRPELVAVAGHRLLAELARRSTAYEHCAELLSPAEVRSVALAGLLEFGPRLGRWVATIDNVLEDVEEPTARERDRRLALAAVMAKRHG
jgi:hypothetical protein